MPNKSGANRGKTYFAPRRYLAMKLNIHARLQRGMAVLETLKFCRDAANNQTLGAAAESEIVTRELADIAICTQMAEIDDRVKRLTE